MPLRKDDVNQHIINLLADADDKIGFARTILYEYGRNDLFDQLTAVRAEYHLIIKQLTDERDEKDFTTNRRD